MVLNGLLVMLALPNMEHLATAMKSAEGRLDVLNQLHMLEAGQLQRARKSQFQNLVIELVDNEELPVKDRILGIRVLTRFGGRSVVEALSRQIEVLSDAPSVAIGREAAKALAKLGAREALGRAVSSPDPEIRASAAGASANSHALCGLLAKDPWPHVRVAAARGLADRPRFAACLTAGLRDQNRAVLLASAEAAAHTGEKGLVAPLRVLAGQPRAYIPARCAALISLGQLGDLEPARKVIKTHLRSGGIIPLARAAVTALSIAGADFAELEPIAKSESAAVLLALADALNSRDNEKSRALVQSILPKIPIRQRARIETNLKLRSPSANLWVPMSQMTMKKRPFNESGISMGESSRIRSPSLLPLISGVSRVTGNDRRKTVVPKHHDGENKDMSHAADFGVTLTQHVQIQQTEHPDARGQLTALLTQIGVAGKLISAQVRRAGLIEVWGSTGETNVQGERVQKLDRIANDTFIEVLRRSGSVAAMASEEEDSLIVIEPEHAGDYIVAFDPLDGSSNIDYSVSIGTIFAIYPRKTDEPIGEAQILRPGNEMVAAGYIVYGSSTVLTYTTGSSVDCFTLDPGVGEFFLTRPNIRMPMKTSVLSVNECNAPFWPGWVEAFVKNMKARNEGEKRAVTGRHIGSLVVDFHRNLLQGGIYLYPIDRRTRAGKLRLIYECNPLAFIAKAAGGTASSSMGPVLDLKPERLHQRCGLIIGPTEDVQMADALIASAPGGAVA